jgi:hypothetical protein
MHAGAWAFNSTLGNIQLALEKRYGTSTGIEDFVRKAQLAHYENARAQFECFAACGWATHKMMAYWMLNSHWPSFYGNLIDYYLSPGSVLILMPLEITARPGLSFSTKHPVTSMDCMFEYVFMTLMAKCATTVLQTTYRFLIMVQTR